MKNHLTFKRTVLSLLVSSLFTPALSFAAQLNLVQYPAGTTRKQPAPNVIISVDNSGSMGQTGITALKNALKATFTPTNLPDGSLRIAYQSLHSCNTIPGNHSSCQKDGISWNTMRNLAGNANSAENSSRGQLFRWIDTLDDGGGTPTHNMMWVAGEYMKTTGPNNPWNEVPGTADSNPVTCRRSYQILMTDGGWKDYPANENFTANMHLRNEDGTLKTFPDGTVYNPTSNQTKIYSDAWGNTTETVTYGSGGSRRTYTLEEPTLSDMAFHYWATDLQPGIANEIEPLIKKAGDETFSDGASTNTISQYWNPKNDVATWQHMTTFSIGFNAATEWDNIGTNPIYNNASGMYGGDYAKLMVGTKRWREPFAAGETNRPEELWHLAINTRGKLYPATSEQDLKNAFLDIVSGIVADNTVQVTGATSTSASSSRADIGIFKSGYNASAGWTGYVRSDIVAQGTDTETANPSWGIKTGVTPPGDRVTTADKLDALSATQISNRLILTTNDVTNAGVPFQWETGVTKLSLVQKTYFGTDTFQADRINFIRGDRTKEGNTGTQPLRVRQSRQGDIVNSNVWFTGKSISNYSYPGYRAFAATNRIRVPMIYVGGNDGMLHGFSALDGSEKLAFIPKGVIKDLPLLTQPGYTHHYYVDGSPFTGDVDINSSSGGTPDWRTMLVGTLGAGGKGYFILDVTKPGSTSSAGPASNFTAANAGNLVVTDQTFNATDAITTSLAAADLGHIFVPTSVEDGNPLKSTQITKMNNGRWAVVLGNGYNSTNERPVLLVQYLDGNKALKRIVAASTGTNATSNGLSAPALVDINGDGTPDVIYAGDLRGNMWKFDVSSSEDAQWNMAFGGLPLFQAKYTSGGSSSTQPITAPPIVRANNRGVKGLMVAFGTGRNVTEADRTDTSVQSFYSVLDNTLYKVVSGNKVAINTANATPTPISSVSQLVQQAQVTGSVGSTGGRTFWKLTDNPVTYTGTSGKKGWYINLPASGERLLKPVEFYDGTTILDIFTQVPAIGGNLTEETCTISPQAEKQYRTLMGIMDGRSPSFQALDSNGDGYYNASDNQAARMDFRTGVTIKSYGIGKRGFRVIRTKADNGDNGSGGGGGGGGSEDNPPPVSNLRPSWRQLR